MADRPRPLKTALNLVLNQDDTASLFRLVIFGLALFLIGQPFWNQTRIQHPQGSRPGLIPVFWLFLKRAALIG